MLPPLPSLRSGRWLLLLLLMLAGTGCDSGRDDPPGVRGRYDATFSYTVEGEPFEEPWTLTLDETVDGQVSGTGVLGITPVDVTGTIPTPRFAWSSSKATAPAWAS